MKAPLTHDPPTMVIDDLGAMFDLYARDLMRYAAGRVGMQAADDIVAQTFLIAHEKLHRFDPARGEMRLWLYGICNNVLRGHKRTEMRRMRALAQSLPANESPESRLVEQLDASWVVASAFTGMPRRQREVLVLFAVAQLSYVEIAGVLGIPVGSVQSALHRARARVRTALAKKGFVE